MSFVERVKNTLLYLESSIVYQQWNLKNDDKVFQRFLGSSAPSVYEVIKNTSLILTNVHESLTPAFPTVPGVVHVGGMHIKTTASKVPKVCFLFFLFVYALDLQLVSSKSDLIEILLTADCDKELVATSSL
jgi:hypothetical protein